METIKTEFPEVLIIRPKIFRDDRGYFIETYNQTFFDEIVGREVNFIQDNESQSECGVVRGLHFQEPPYTQAKLLKVVKGSIVDIIVDIRIDSDTFGEHLITKLDDIHKEQLFVPRGFAHGFVALEDDTILQYKVDNKYAPDFDSGILFDSIDINVREEIGHEEFILSEKDQQLKPFKEIGLFKTREYELNC